MGRAKPIFTGNMINFVVVLLVFICSSTVNTAAWSNGGKSSSATDPDYGTHDWIAQHALEWLPAGEKQFIVNNLEEFLYGTELPDFADAVGGGGIGDTQKHHVYYRQDGSVQDDSGAERARSTFSEALGSLRAGNLVAAARSAGTLAHYLGDLAAYPHVMGSSTSWGAEVHHQDYEDYVNARTNTYSSMFISYLSFDGSLENLSAYEGALRLAHDSTFDESGGMHTAVWMDANYDWGNLEFSTRVGRSLNSAINVVADVLHTLWIDSGRQPDDVMSFIVQNALLVIAVVILVIVVTIIILRPRQKSRRKGRRR